MSNELVDTLINLSEEQRLTALRMFYTDALDGLCEQTAASLLGQAVQGKFTRDKLNISCLDDIISNEKLQQVTDAEFINLVYFDVVYRAIRVSQKDLDGFEDNPVKEQVKGVLQA